MPSIASACVYTLFRLKKYLNRSERDIGLIYVLFYFNIRVLLILASRVRANKATDAVSLRFL
jgi:hypothetical protein